MEHKLQLCKNVSLTRTISTTMYKMIKKTDYATCTYYYRNKQSHFIYLLTEPFLVYYLQVYLKRG